MRYFIELSYNGEAYHGWQNQPNAVTVQEKIEKALSILLKTPITIMGAGRTDTGVHAQQMFAHFNFDGSINKTDLIFKLNAFLPNDIAIHNLFKVYDNVHARFDAVSRTYLYRIALKKNVFNYKNTFYVKQVLDVERMQAASKILFQYKNFQCFSKSNTDVKTYHCTIFKAEWCLKNAELQFTIKADRFLRNMVRAIVGTLIDIGLKKNEIADMHHIIKSKNRGKAGFSVPARGLYLMEVEYPNTIKLND